MGRTQGQVLAVMIGEKDLQIAALTSALEDANERAEALKQAHDALAEAKTAKTALRDVSES